MVKGVCFADYRDTGDPVFASRVYNSQLVDELVFLDIDATSENRETNIDVISAVSKCLCPGHRRGIRSARNAPFTGKRSGQGSCNKRCLIRRRYRTAPMSSAVNASSSNGYSSR